jgi:BirA family transcriptional regulator, biotin operon repressor / biotin---[acetyl-CoA-carboxylase] ligase
MNIGAVIQSFETSTSTNDLAKTLAEKGAEEGTIIMAEEQTKGRGTKGRSWDSPRGKGIYASVILRPKQKDISLLPLMAGVACVDAIRGATGLEVNLKWPNDIVWRKKKIGGILSESGFLGGDVTYVILGLGLNVSQKRDDFPAELRRSATSLRLALGVEVDRAELERILWAALDRWYGLFRQGKAEKIIRAFEAYFIIPIGKVVKVEKEGTALSGAFLGIDPQGRLRLQKNRQEMLLSPAEIQGLSFGGRGR